MNPSEQVTNVGGQAWANAETGPHSFVVEVPIEEILEAIGPDGLVIEAQDGYDWDAMEGVELEASGVGAGGSQAGGVQQVANEEESDESDGDDDDVGNGASTAWDSHVEVSPVNGAVSFVSFVRFHRQLALAILKGDVKRQELLLRNCHSVLLDPSLLPNVELDAPANKLEKRVRKGHIYNFYHLAIYGENPDHSYHRLLRAVANARCAGKHFTKLALKQGLVTLAMQNMLYCRNCLCHQQHGPDALSYACSIGSLDAVKNICEILLDNWVPFLNRNLLGRAVAGKNPEVLRYLVEEQLVPVSIGAMKRAIRENQPAFLTYLVARYPRPANYRKLVIEAIRNQRSRLLWLLERRYRQPVLFQDLIQYSPSEISLAFLRTLVMHADDLYHLRKFLNQKGWDMFNRELDLTKSDGRLIPINLLRARMLNDVHLRYLALLQLHEENYAEVVSRFFIHSQREQRAARFFRIAKRLPLEIKETVVRAMDHLPYLPIPQISIHSRLAQSTLRNIEREAAQRQNNPNSNFPSL